jgi:3-dehydroquinate synthase
MMDKIIFTIEGKEFFVRKDLVKSDSFVVRSIPRSYPVKWAEQTKPQEIINNLMAENSENILFIDKNVYDIYGNYLEIPKSKIFVAEATEEFKTLDGFIGLIEFLQKNKFTKGESLIVVGGGIIQDIGAFAGASYKRGIRWIYLPTTLLAMCDSCIGGKAGINHNNAKNQLAIFSSPSQVIIDPIFLETLTDRDIKAGLGEILKLHIMGGKEFLKIYKHYITDAMSHNYPAFKPLILGSLNIKKSIIEKDEFELKHRKALNYGHTVGHALEVLSNYRIPHGQAVVLGMIVANELSNRKHLLSRKENNLLKNLSFDLLDQDILRGLSISKLGELLQKDKKTSGSLLTFILLKSIGETRLVPIHLNSIFIDEISEIIAEYL